MKLHCDRIKSSPPSPTQSTVPVVCLAILRPGLSSSPDVPFHSDSGHGAFQFNGPRQGRRREHGNLRVGNSPSVPDSLVVPYRFPRPQARPALPRPPSQSSRSLKHLLNWGSSRWRYTTVNVSSEMGHTEEWTVPHILTRGCPAGPNVSQFAIANSNLRAEVERCVLPKDNKEKIRGILDRLQNNEIILKSQNFARVDHSWVGESGDDEVKLFTLRLCKDEDVTPFPAQESPLFQNRDDRKAWAATIVNGLAELHNIGLVMGPFGSKDLKVEDGRWKFTNLDRVRNGTFASSEREKIKDWTYAIKVLDKIHVGRSMMEPGGSTFSSPAAAEEYVRNRFGVSGGYFTKLPVESRWADKRCNLDEVVFRMKEYERSLHKTPYFTSTDPHTTEDSSEWEESFEHGEYEWHRRL